MADLSLIQSYFAKITGRQLLQAECDEISAAFRKESFQKKELLVQAGDSNTRHYYIEKGLLRLFIIDQNGKEFNVLFARERQWIGDLGTPAATPYYIEAVEKSEVFSIDENGFQKLITSYPELSRNIRRSYIFLQKRFVSILSKTAEENYEDLLNHDAELVQRLPQYHISSYLGVTPVFLSKILAKKAKKS